jgi:hypothetical protein
VVHRSRLEHCRCRLKLNTPHAGGSREKPLQEHSRSCRASGARPAGLLTRPHGTAFSNQGEECPISKCQHPRDPNGYTRRCSGATVGDSHKGPLNNQGNPLKTRKNAKRGLNHEPKAHARHDHDPGGPRSPPGWHGGRPLGRGSPRSRVRRSHEQNPPRSRPRRPSGEVRLARGLDAPSGEVRLARGLNTPSGEVRLARGHLHARSPRSCPRVPAFNAPTPQDAHHDPNMPGNRVPVLFHRLPGGGHPRHCVALCDEAGVSSVTLRRLTPYG